MARTPDGFLSLLSSNTTAAYQHYNTNLFVLAAFLLTPVKNRTRTSPPTSPAEGDLYIVASGGGGSDGWGERALDNDLAYFHNGLWSFLSPFAGLIKWVEDENKLLVWNESSWVEVGLA